MRQIVLIFLALCSVAVIGGMSYAYFVYIPQKVEEKIIGSFNRFGFEKLAYGTLTHKRGQIILSDIALDSDKFSTIEQMNIQFSLFKFLIDPYSAQNITVHGLKLTGELSDNLDIRIAGWENSKEIIQNLQNFPAGTITFDDASIDLLTDDFGGINVKYNALVDMEKTGGIRFKANVTSTQRKLAFSAKIDGKMSPDSTISLDADASDITIALPQFNVRRGVGKLHTQYAINGEHPALAITGDLQIASLNWHALPLRNIHAIIERKAADDYTIDMDGTTFGRKAIKWKTSLKPDNNTILSETLITPERISDLRDFLKEQTKLTLKADIPESFLHLAQPVLTIKNTLSAAPFKTEGVLKLTLKKPDLHLTADYRSDAKSDNILGTIKLDKTTIKPSIAEDQDKTYFDVSSFGEFTLKNYATAPQVDWFIHTDILNGMLDFDALAIKGIHGSVFVGGNKQKKPTTKTLPFTLPLKSGIAQRGTLDINLNDADKPILNALRLKIYNGEILTDFPIIKDGKIEKKNKLTLTDINISKLIHDAGFNNIDVSGVVGGIIPFEAKDGGIHVNGGILQSQNTGVLKLPDDIIMGLFPGNTPKMIAIRAALQNYHYEYFEVRFDGDLNDRVMMTLNSRGINPDLKTKDPVDLNLQIETQISLLFQNLMKKP